MPQVVPDCNGVSPSSTRDIEKSPVNSAGWYIYDELNREEVFTVRAIAPRELFQLKSKRIISGLPAATHYLHSEYWQNIKERKGQIDSILLDPNSLSQTEAIDRYREGDRLLLMHTYGGIGGKKQKFPQWDYLSDILPSALLR